MVKALIPNLGIQLMLMRSEQHMEHILQNLLCFITTHWTALAVYYSTWVNTGRHLSYLEPCTCLTEASRLQPQYLLSLSTAQQHSHPSSCHKNKDFKSKTRTLCFWFVSWETSCYWWTVSHQVNVSVSPCFPLTVPLKCQRFELMV